MNRLFHRQLNDRLMHSDVKRIAACVALVGAGMFAGAAWPPTGAARAEAQTPVQPPHFQSGGQMSLPLLKEIAVTLKQMDARLARIETAAQQFRPTRANPAPAN